VEHAQRTAELFERKRDEALAELARQAGGRWTMTDARSNQRLEPVFNRHGVPFPRTAPTEVYADGQASFQGDWMRGYEGQAQWLPRLVYAARKYDDLSSKFMRNYILGYAHRGRIHPTVNQYRTEGGGTRSHRVSYSDPPLQQMPSRDDETAPLIRSCFLPEPGELWCACDYSQQEFRLIVHYAELMKKDRADEAGAAYRNNPATDFHDMVAEMTGLPRRRAKDVNFAVAFSAGVGRFADMTGLTREQAQEIMGQYDEKMPFVKQLGQACSALALRRGYIRLIDGARCHFDDWEPGWRDAKKESDWLRATQSGALGVMPCRYDEALRRTRDEDHPWGRSALRRAYGHKAMNRLIQGSAARQTKRAMLLMYREGIVPRLQMHDEVSASCSSKKQGDMIAEMMREAHTLLVPMKVDEEWGITWGAAAQRKDANKQVTYRATYEEAVAEQEALGVS
jgi:DNA polymerase I-like protein with 3'-5' exonuclease and polymerase domains